jgi:ribosomal protein S21|tara:strand:+ start:323 stop:622 length:300 start_codon:yes stop_codon:yes gene_type:complete
MEYQKNKTDSKPRFKKTERPLGFQGYYVEVRPGEDAVRAYRKIKRWIKEDKFIDQIRATNTFQKPSEIKREKAKERKKILRKLRREREGNIFSGRTNRR